MDSNSHILNEYLRKTQKSADLFKKAKNLFPSAITHDSRHTTPYGIYVNKAYGSNKWDVDGNVYVDYFGGHGALILGHGNKAVEAAVAEALTCGTHFGANHPLEVRWADAIKRLLPSAQRVRFTSSGTEATLMALRLARSFTNRPKIMRFKTHFHGWHDHMAFGVSDHFNGDPSPGVLREVVDQVVLMDPNNIEFIKAILKADKNIGAVIIEPTGGSGGMVPLESNFLSDLRAITQENDVLLIFDEVVTGFRVHMSGAQGLYGIEPDLTTLAKILAGGLPGGAVVGREDIIAHLDFNKTRETGIGKIHHPGTFNANPLSAAAGAQTLEIVYETDPGKTASRYGKLLRTRLNDVLRQSKIAWSIYGEHSSFFIFMNPKNRAIDPADFNPLSVSIHELKEKPSEHLNKLRLALLIAGVDINGSGAGLISATHEESDLERTVSAFQFAVEMVSKEESLPRI